MEADGTDRGFIRATLADNRYLDRDSYQLSLANLDPITRAQLLEGDWSARPSGGMFRKEWFQVLDEAPADARRIRFWDLAATAEAPGKDPDYSVGTLVGLKDGVYYIEDVQRVRATPMAVEELIKQTAYLDRARPGHVSIRMEQEPGSSGLNTIDHYARNVMVGHDFLGRPSTGSKLERARPVSSAAEAGNIRLVQGSWISNFLDEADAFPNGSHDDQVDAVSGAFREFSQQGRGIGLYF